MTLKYLLDTNVLSDHGSYTTYSVSDSQEVHSRS
jgi:hypothetical protein